MSVTLEEAYFLPLSSGHSFTAGEELKFEALRLKTFECWNAYDKAHPIELAKAGFFYTGQDAQVQCFSCQITKGDWLPAMKPLDEHQNLNANCVFVRQVEGVNYPFYTPEEPAYQQILDALHQQYCRPGDLPDSVSAHQMTSGQSATPVDSSATVSQGQAIGSTQTQFPVVAHDSAYAGTSRQAIGIGYSHGNEVTPMLEHSSHLKSEAARFATYDHRWPDNAHVDPRELASAGFFYTGIADRVQCVFCRGILRNWDDEDVPMEEHQRHFSNCAFIQGREVGNIPDPTVTSTHGSQFMNVTSAPVVSDASLGIVTDRPKHPNYAIEATRVSSYREWPVGKEQTPQQLAKAGFFYAGFGDSVKCFFCDGGLRTWEPGDDPWLEHARWFPRCPYVRQVKGEEYIRSALQGRNLSDFQTASRSDGSAIPSRPQGSNANGESSLKTVADSSTGSSQTRVVEARDVSARMDTPLVQAVLNMDIPVELVKKAVQKRLAETGDNFRTSEALLEAVFSVTNNSEGSGPESKTDSRSEASSSGNKEMKKSETQGDSITEAKEASPMDENMDSDEETQSLVEENRQLKEQRQCKICMDAEVNVVFLPCGHLVCCAACAPALRKCPICRGNIRGSVRTFMS